MAGWLPQPRLVNIEVTQVTFCCAAEDYLSNSILERKTYEFKRKD
jgi:hypothetical protein